MGPLNGIRVVEFTGIGPAPMAGMLLADLGASVIRLDRPAAADAMNSGAGGPHLSEGRTVLPADLKSEEGLALARDLASRADVLLEGFRPGVMERLGLGPEVCLEANPRLVYARVTGWGQDGPLARAAGHDMNYISVNGALHAIGRAGARRSPRSTSWATSPGAPCSRSPASSARWSSASPPVAARSWTPRWWTAARC